MKRFLAFLVFNLLFFNVFPQTNDSIRNIDIEEIIVTTTRSNTKLKDIPQKVEIIDQSILTSIPSENTADILKRVTNIDLVQYPGVSAAVGMRGFSPGAHARTYTLILINGLPSASTNLAGINTENIERVEIIKGPYSVLYGSDAMGGLINVITKQSPKEASGNISITPGSFGALKLSGDVGGPIGRKTNFGLGYSMKEQAKDYRIGGKNLLHLTPREKAILDDESFGDIMENTMYQIHDLNARIEHRFNGRWTFNSVFLYTIAHDIGIPGNYWGSYGQTKKDIDRINISAPVKREDDKNMFTISPYFSRETVQDYDNNTDTGFVSLRSWVKEYGFKLTDIFKLGPVKMLLGADFDIYTYDSQRFKKATELTMPYQPDNKIAKTALIIQATYSSDKLHINSGVRLDRIHYAIEANELLKSEKSDSKYITANPSFGILYSFPPGLKLHNSAGTAFSVPDAFKVAGSYSVSEYFPAWNYWWIMKYAGNKDLKPESSFTFDCGIGFSSSGNAFSADMTFFNTDHTNKIVEYIKPNTDTTSFKNASSGLYRGFEAMASLNLGKFFDKRFKLELYSNATILLKSTFKDLMKDKSENDVKITRDMQYVRKANGTFGIIFDNYKGFTTRVNARYAGSRLEMDNFGKIRPSVTADDYYQKGGYTVEDKILKHPDFFIFDFSVSYSVKGNKQFGILISNFFDENYTEKDGYNMPGRAVMGNFSYLF